jgi:hypothetical protein
MGTNDEDEDVEAREGACSMATDMTYSDLRLIAASSCCDRKKKGNCAQLPREPVWPADGRAGGQAFGGAGEEVWPDGWSCA